MLMSAGLRCVVDGCCGGAAALETIDVDAAEVFMEKCGTREVSATAAGFLLWVDRGVELTPWRLGLDSGVMRGVVFPAGLFVTDVRPGAALVRGLGG